ncbi:MULTISPECIES: M16 family metallopeptidase [Clostridium]|uniref:Insulinase family protein n=1 Tax=Clostridium cadaveris TaxID=1529 RepID=A0A316M5A0_9CLOT|nr:pitrilysin family protein [Clostridium cadaveris]MDU4951526.1 pitrilysin family protein [Clostridium sp.]MDY4950497.1 pitrilysin family protein [Clostridium cadaveris]NME63253.1 insulinase family protein [Clostridium cadaveris]NWK10209.1 insulinase family protein [Clostridium cadaveris]PWL52808.1 MAG: insulinase family protein [Clostridium cadaveris]
MSNSMFDSRKYTMSNGLNIVTIKKDTQIACVHFGVKIGAMYESVNEKGISHFLEHMMFKGTTTRNNEKINEELEMLGGEYNAYTDYGCTVYSVTCIEEELLNAMNLLGDMIMNSVFPKEEIEKERGVILSEIRASKDDIEDLSFKIASEKAYENSPLKYDISGSEENVKKFNKRDIDSFYSRFYVPNNSYMVVVSSLDHEDVIKCIENIFEKWEQKEVVLPKVEVEDNNPGMFVSCKKDLEQSTIVYLYGVNSISKDMELPFKILSHRLGESANSILFRELRENRGLAYDIYTHLDLSDNIKTLAIYTAVDKENTEETIDIINTAIDNIKNEVVKFDDRTMELMKKVHKTAVLSTLEDSTDLCNYAVHQCLDGESIYEFINDMDDLNNINKESIYKVARKFLNNPTIHILKEGN